MASEELIAEIQPQQTQAPLPPSGGLLDPGYPRDPLDSTLRVATERTPIPEDPPARLVHASQQAQSQRSLITEYERQETELEPAPTAEGEAPVASEEDDLPSISQERVAMEEEAFNDLPQIDPVEQPLETNQEAMNANFNTTLDKESVDAEKIANLPTIGKKEEGESVKNVDFVQVAEEGDKAKAMQAELQQYLSGEEGTLTKAFRMIDMIFAPTMAPLAAALAPLAQDRTAGTFLGDLQQGAQQAGDAFNERFFRWFAGDGDVMPDFSTKIVEKYLPGVPEEHRATTGLVLEMLITLPMSFGMAGAMQKAIGQTSRLARTDTFGGIMKEAVYGYLGWTPASGTISASTKLILDQIKKDGTDKEKIAELIHDAELAQHGDEGAFARLSEALSGGVQGKNIAGTEEVIAEVSAIFGGANQPSFTINKATNEAGELSQKALREGISRRVAENDVRFNLTAMTDEGVFNQTFDEAVEALSQQYRIQEGLNPDIPDPSGGFKSQSNAKTLALAKQNQQALDELYGIPIERMDIDEVTALRVITTSSAKQVLEFINILGNPGISQFNRQLAEAGLAKQLLVHHLINAKVTGAASAGGQFLQSFNIKVC